MKIISSFKDVYDFSYSSSTNGTVYTREQEHTNFESCVDILPFLHKVRPIPWTTEDGLDPSFIQVYLAGACYLGVMYRDNWYYSYDNLLEHASSTLKECLEYSFVKDWFYQLNKPTTVDPELHRIIGAPLLITRDKSIVINPRVGDYQLHKHLLPYQIHADIERFLTYVMYVKKPSLVPEPNKKDPITKPIVVNTRLKL